MESRMKIRVTIALALAAAGCGSKLISAGSTGGGGVTPGTWVNVTGALAGKSSECGNLSYLSAPRDADLIIASVALKGLWSLGPGSANWSQLGNSVIITNRATSIVYDPNNPGTWYESGLYNGGAVYKTTDFGATWNQLGGITHSDSVGIDFKDPLRRTLLAGGHEAPGVLQRSTDSGANWTNIGANPNLAGAGSLSIAVVIDAQTHLLGTYLLPGSSSGSPGVFRTTDGGATWTQVYSGGGVRWQPLFASDKSVYWLLDNNAGVIRSTDSGATWTQTAGAGTVSNSSGGNFVEIYNGRLVTLGADHLVMSSDMGRTWHPFGAALPYVPSGVVYSHFRKAFYIWRFDCTSFSPSVDPVPDNAIERLDFDESTQ
jgi:photosystem II stability/assembly factor-like uncharacterized protein